MRNMKHWQDPLNALVGAWLVLSPWAMGFEAQMAPTASSVVVGLALIAASLHRWAPCSCRAPGRNGARPCWDCG